MNNLLTHYPVNWIDGMKLSSRTHSYYTRHELKSLNTWKRVCDLRQRGAAVCYMLCFMSRVMRKFLFPERASTM